MIFLGIDAGGTKTTAVAVDLKEEKILTAQGAPGAISAIGVNGVNSLLVDLLKKLNLSDSLAEIQAATFGFSGVGRVEVRKKVEAEIKKIGISDFRVITDGELLHYSAFGKNDGILIEAGTGAVCISRNNNVLNQIGGWGFLLGDEGGGYQIGRDAIRISLEENDKNLPVSELSNELIKIYDVEKREELINIIYSAGNVQKIISSLAITVCDLAKQGNSDALIIVEEAADNLFDLLQTALTYYDKDAVINISFAGSILSKESPVFNSFKNKLEKIDYNIELIDISIEPAVAGVLYAIDSSGEVISEQLLNSLKGLTL